MASSKQLHTPNPTCGSWGLSSQSSLGLKPRHGESHIPCSVQVFTPCPVLAGQIASQGEHRRSHLQASGPWCQTEDTWGPLPGWDGAVLLLPKFLWDVECGQAAVPPPSPPTLPGNDAQLGQGIASAWSCCPGLSHAHPCPHSHLLKLPRIQGTHLLPNPSCCVSVAAGSVSWLCLMGGDAAGGAGKVSLEWDSSWDSVFKEEPGDDFATRLQ